MPKDSSRIRKPNWLRAKLPSGPAYGSQGYCRRQPTSYCLPCPNVGEVGLRNRHSHDSRNVCTRACTFLCRASGKPTGQFVEPPRVADAVAKMGFNTVFSPPSLAMITDGGAKVWAPQSVRFDIVTLLRQLKCSFLISRVSLKPRSCFGRKS